MAITTDIDRIRLEVGCSDVSATVTLYDDEITYALTTERTFWGGAARCAEMLSMKYMQKADVRLGRSLMLSYTTLSAQYALQAKRLRFKANAGNVPWVGGMSVSDKQAYAENDLLVQPLFARNMEENPWVGGYTSDAPDATADDDGDVI
jgi:hypothetical protein